MLLVERGELDEATRLFEGYLELNSESALALSYVGMLKAVQGGHVTEGISLCQQALKKDPREVLCYLNLAKAYLTSGDRYLCVRTLHKGLKIRSPHRELLLNFHKTIGVRRSPVIPSSRATTRSTTSSAALPGP